MGILTLAFYLGVLLSLIFSVKLSIIFGKYTSSKIQYLKIGDKMQYFGVVVLVSALQYWLMWLFEKFLGVTNLFSGLPFTQISLPFYYFLTVFSLNLIVWLITIFIEIRKYQKVRRSYVDR